MHTPGPWDLHHQRPDLMAGDCDWSLQTERDGAFLLFCHHPDAPAQANARLIAAAPVMLASLKEARNLLMQNKDPLHCIEEALVPIDYAVGVAEEVSAVD